MIDSMLSPVPFSFNLFFGQKMRIRKPPEGGLL